jgi:hypothetical protein
VSHQVWWDKPASKWQMAKLQGNSLLKWLAITARNNFSWDCQISEVPGKLSFATVDGFTSAFTDHKG